MKKVKETKGGEEAAKAKKELKEAKANNLETMGRNQNDDAKLIKEVDAKFIDSTSSAASGTASTSAVAPGTAPTSAAAPASAGAPESDVAVEPATAAVSGSSSASATVPAVGVW